MVQAARELTSVAVSRGRSGDTEGGRSIAGHVDSRNITATRRKAGTWCALLGVVLAVYAAVMFTRVLRLAEPLGSTMFSALAAALITVFTAGVPILMAYRWSRGNALGDELREHGAIIAESRNEAQHLHELTEAAIASSEHFTELAHDQLERASQTIHDGYRVIAVGLQKAARMLCHDSVMTAAPENLFPAERVLRTRAVDTLSRTAAIVAGAQKALCESDPFPADEPAPNPWHHRTAPRRATPNPAHMDPAQVGSLHQPPS